MDNFNYLGKREIKAEKGELIKKVIRNYRHQQEKRNLVVT